MKARTGYIPLLKKGHVHKDLTKKQRQQQDIEKMFDVKFKVRY